MFFFQDLDGKIVGWRHLMTTSDYERCRLSRLVNQDYHKTFGMLLIWALQIVHLGPLPPGSTLQDFFPPWISAAIRAVFHCKKWLSRWAQWFLEFVTHLKISSVWLSSTLAFSAKDPGNFKDPSRRKESLNTTLYLKYQCPVWMLPGVSWKISLPISLQFILWDNASCHHPEEKILRAVAPASASTTAKKILEKKPLLNVALVVVPGWKSGDSYGTWKKLAIWGWFYYGKPSGLAAWSQNANGTGSW